MERSTRKKAPSKKAAALEAIAGIRNGERRRIDDLNVEEDDVYEAVEDDGSHAHAYEDEEPDVPSKRASGTGMDRAPRDLMSR